MKELKKLLRLLLSACLLIALFPAVSLAANAVGTSYTLSLNPDASEYTYARIPDRRVEAGTPVGELPVLSRSGYYFGGWYTGQIGEGQRYTADTIMPERNVTLYAYWYIHNPGAAVNEPGESEDSISVTTGSGGVITSVLTVTDSGARVQMQKTGFDSVAAGPRMISRSWRATRRFPASARVARPSAFPMSCSRARIPMRSWSTTSTTPMEIRTLLGAHITKRRER